MDNFEKFNKMVGIMRDMHEPGGEPTFRFFVGPNQEASMKVYPHRMKAIPMGLINESEVPWCSTNSRAVVFDSGTYVTHNARLAAALTFEPNVIPSPSWLERVQAALEPKPEPEPEPKARSRKARAKDDDDSV